MHLKRWLTALIFLPIVIYIIGFSPPCGFYLFITMIMLISLYEFFNITKCFPLVFPLCFYFLSILMVLLLLNTSLYLLPFIISCFVIFPMLLCILQSYDPKPALFENIAKGLLGLVYISLPLWMLMIIYKHPYGKVWIFFLLWLIILDDTGAFYFGRILGKHHLHKKISPKKTWEGSLGGLVCSTIGAFVYLRIFKLCPISYNIFFLVILLSIMGQIGDLAESLIKRCYGVKDSGKILPGHGGLLDRIDSFLFTIPILYGYMMWK